MGGEHEANQAMTPLSSKSPRVNVGKTTSLLLSSLLGGGSHQVQSGTGLEEFDLTGVEGVGNLDLLLGAVLVGDFDIEGLAGGELVQTEDGDLVSAGDLFVVGGVLEPQGQDSLLLQVCLVDSGKRPDDDGSATQKSGFEGGVFSGRTFTVVFITDDDPGDTCVSVLGSNGRNGTEGTVHLVENLVGLATVGVDGTDQTVLGNVLQVTSVLQPRSTGRDVVSGTLAQSLDQDGSLDNVLAVPWLEGLQELESVRLGVNGDLDVASVLGRSLEGVLSRVVTSSGEFVTGRVGELELLAIGTLQGVGQRVEGQVTGKGHGGNEIGRGDKGVRSRVGVVSASEISVVRSDDGILLSLLDVSSVPLTDTGSTGVGEDDTSDVFERLDETVSVNGGSDLFGSGGDGELGLADQTVGLGLLGDGGGSGHVFVRRVGAGTDQSDLELRGPVVVLDSLGKFGDGRSQIRGEGTVDVGLEFVQVQVDDLVVFGILVGSQVVLEGFSVLGNVASLGGLEVAAHSLVVREDRGGGTDFGTHVTDGSHTRAREGLDTGTVVFDDSTGSTLDGQGTSDAQDDVYGKGSVKFMQRYAESFTHPWG